ncbi:DUF1684 domain-containing protein [Microvirga sp. 2MCAF38]|uniref:DUF1684 domain-containing protein n=1 Tax=Microvirga sp. 2MCAF38 TaxID=3232989 RepID=UPI003F969C57
MIVLDFNKAINPPCAFTALATCPPSPTRKPSLAACGGWREGGAIPSLGRTALRNTIPRLSGQENFQKSCDRTARQAEMDRRQTIHPLKTIPALASVRIAIST